MPGVSESPEPEPLEESDIVSIAQVIMAHVPKAHIAFFKGFSQARYDLLLPGGKPEEGHSQ